MATTWVYWLGRLVKLAIVAPSTLMLGFLALVNLGMKPIAEPGRWDPPFLDRLGGFLLLAGLASLWMSILTGSGPNFSRRTRVILVAALMGGVIGWITTLTPNDLSEFNAPFAAGIPMVVMAAVEGIRLLRQP